MVEEDPMFKLQKRAESLPALSEEERKQIAEERANTDDTMQEWAQLQTNGDIALHNMAILKSGVSSSGGSVIHPGDGSYEEAKAFYQLNSPGDTRTFVKHLVDGEWVIVAENFYNESK